MTMCWMCNAKPASEDGAICTECLEGDGSPMFHRALQHRYERGFDDGMICAHEEIGRELRDAERCNRQLSRLFGAACFVVAILLGVAVAGWNR